MSRDKVWILDAMGVLYRAGDDVGELLVPFVREHRGQTAAVEQAYLEASLGRLEPDAFWRRVGLDPALEDAYLARHTLMPGLLAFLEAGSSHPGGLWCLSNDIGRWSRKLRTRFGLEPYFDGWIISSEVRARKPDPQIYLLAAQRTGAQPGQVSFVDDRLKNLDAARRAGWHTVHFGHGQPDQNGGHPAARDFGALPAQLLAR